jgi:hypothetical protein
MVATRGQGRKKAAEQEQGKENTFALLGYSFLCCMRVTVVV